MMWRVIVLMVVMGMLSGFRPALTLGEVPVAAEPALTAMHQACEAGKAGPEVECDSLKQLLRHGDAVAMQHWLSEHFTLGRRVDKGLLTGYYLPLLEGSLERDAEYRYPVWGVPKDFRTPYPMTRQQIDTLGLAGKAKPLLWVKDKIDLFFLHIQGSGRVRLPDGRVIGLGFAAKTGQPYRSIGKLLIEQGEIPREAMSLQALKRWLRAHPQQQDRVLWYNPSYVFFQRQKVPQAVGAQGIALTPKGSLAVDAAHIPYGTPVLIQTTLPGQRKPQWILTVAQDTGSAIQGETRADWFLGFGREAENLAGALKQPATFYLLRAKTTGAGHE